MLTKAVRIPVTQGFVPSVAVRIRVTKGPESLLPPAFAVPCEDASGTKKEADAELQLRSLECDCRARSWPDVLCLYLSEEV